LISWYSPPPTPVLNDQFSFWSPYFKAEYTNQQFARRFGVGAQYFRAYALGNIWFEILRDQLRVEFKYASPIFRSAEEWEPPFFWTLSIPFTFSL
jgi:hypothetical protein